MTKQEYYNLLVEAAHNGTFPSWSEKENSCLYRCDKTPTCYSRCAIGLLIPDEKYVPLVEKMPLNDLMAIIEPVAGLNIYDFKDIQITHDSTAQKNGFKTSIFMHKLNKLKCFADVDKAQAKKEHW